MAYKYPHFIPQNTAPKGAKKISVYNADGAKVMGIPFGGLAPPKAEKLYSFGLVSDTHIWHLTADWDPNTKFDNALTYFDRQGCALCIVCGDITEMGFYVQEMSDGQPVTLPDGYPSMIWDENQFKIYSEVCSSHKIPVFELCGNHENYGNKNISDHLDALAQYTGRGLLSYSVSADAQSERNVHLTAVGKDIFILLGQPSHNKVMSDADFEWLRTALEANKNRRCFVFVHAYIEEDSGDPGDFRENSIFDGYWGAENTEAFKELLVEYPNVVLFHGHSHMKFECQQYYDSTKTLDAGQESYKAANYTEKNGFKSVHIPSLSKPRNIDLDSTTKPTPEAMSESQGYIVDVYDDCIVLNGMDFINSRPVSLGVFKIVTELTAQ